MTKLPLSPKLKAKFYAFKYGLYAFIFFMIFALAFVLGKHIEAFFLFIAYISTRYLFPKTFHHPNAYWCAFWSILAFWACLLVTLPLRVSLISTVPIGLLLCFVAYKVQDYIDEKSKELEPIAPKEFAIETCTREEFLAQCRKVNLNARNTEIAVAYFFDKTMDLWDIATKYSIDYDSAKQQVWRIKKKILKKG